MAPSSRRRVERRSLLLETVQCGEMLEDHRFFEFFLSPKRQPPINRVSFAVTIDVSSNELAWFIGSLPFY